MNLMWFKAQKFESCSFKILPHFLHFGDRLIQKWDSPTIKWVPPLLIILYFILTFFLSISLRNGENREDLGATPTVVLLPFVRQLSLTFQKNVMCWSNLVCQAGLCVASPNNVHAWFLDRQLLYKYIILYLNVEKGHENILLHSTYDHCFFYRCHTMFY
jgi:hypothetical protein